MRVLAQLSKFSLHDRCIMNVIIIIAVLMHMMAGSSFGGKQLCVPHLSRQWGLHHYEPQSRLSNASAGMSYSTASRESGHKTLEKRGFELA